LLRNYNQTILEGWLALLAWVGITLLFTLEAWTITLSSTYNNQQPFLPPFISQLTDLKLLITAITCFTNLSGETIDLVGEVG